MKKTILLMSMAILITAFAAGTAYADTQLWVEPVEMYCTIGQGFNLDLMADIDEDDKILGYGFDLSFDNGSTYVSAPGQSGSYITFTGFESNSALFEASPAMWDDGDTISAEVPFGNDDIWGENICLGSLAFMPFGTGTENIYIGPAAGDYCESGEDGLIGATALMPNNPTATATVSPVPVTGAFWLLGSGLVGLIGIRRKQLSLS